MLPAASRARGRDNVVETLLRACRADPVLGQAGRHVVVVAFSGGPDSTALLHALARGAGALRLDLHAVHVDHGLRAAASAEAAVATRFAAELQVPLRVVLVRPRGRGEEAARRARHAVLERVAGELGAGTIALGHTADDQAETVLLHLLRGAGLEGLAAMAPREGLRFRPLLDVSRKRVHGYCARHGLVAVRDESNDDPAYTRNRVRSHLIPLLERDYNPRVGAALNRLARAARDEHAVVETAAREWLAANPGALPRPAFLALAAAVQAHVLRLAWADAAGWSAPAGDAERIGQALRLARRKGGGVIRLGREFELIADATHISIRPVEPA